MLRATSERAPTLWMGAHISAAAPPLEPFTRSSASAHHVHPAQALPNAAAAHNSRLSPQAIESVPKISEGYNPATWMLEVANHGVESRTGQDFAELYNNSDMRTCAFAASHVVDSALFGQQFIEVLRHPFFHSLPATA